MLKANSIRISEAFTFKYCFRFPYFLPKPTWNLLEENLLTGSNARSPPREAHIENTGNGFIPLKEWQGWGPVSPVPAIVNQIVEDLKALEKSIDAQINFDGNGGKLQCWLAMEDCIVQKSSAALYGMLYRLAVYASKGLSTQNNTGKLLWQVFAVQAATLCLFGIAEDEEIMWDAFKHAEKKTSWWLYPSKNAITISAQDILGRGYSEYLECTPMMAPTMHISCSYWPFFQASSPS